MRARRVSALDGLPQAHREFLETGAYERNACTGMWFFVYAGGALPTWRRLGAQLLAEWVAAHPGTRPWGWWRFEGHEPRQRLGGVGEPYADGLSYGVPSYWTSSVLGSLIGVVAIDCLDPPTFESEATYLERHGLLTVAERRRLAADAFEPERVEISEDTSNAYKLRSEYKRQ